jgi:hypothetical protein
LEIAMNLNLKTLARRATALVALGAVIGLNVAHAQPQGLSVNVVAAERFRAVQEGATTVKLLPSATALPQATDRAPAVSDIAADKRVPNGDSIAADKRVPNGDSFAADKRAPNGDSVSADRCRCSK